MAIIGWEKWLGFQSAVAGGDVTDEAGALCEAFTGGINLIDC